MLEWLPEPYQAYGGFAADGIKKVLGRPPLDPLVVLVREAVQNSWDARTRDQVVSFRLSHRTLSTSQRSAIKRDIFDRKSPAGTGLADSLTAGATLLIASDRNTTGLSGPIRADTEVAAGVEDRFVKLVFNVGQPTESEQRGGSYGFGKTISYVVSRAGATIIRTRTTVGDRRQERLIAAALGEQYTQNRRRFTGRHWWGKLVDDRVEPVVGSEAAAISEMLGLEPFRAFQTGTDIAVVSPDYGERTPAEALRLMADALAWYFWPKMIPSPPSGGPPMLFSVDLDGVPVEIPEPADTPPLDSFIESLQVIRRAESGKVPRRSSLTTLRNIESRNPKAHLGLLAVTPVLGSSLVAVETVDGFGSPPTSDEVHHIACMRHPELVVEYVEGPWNPSSGIHWAGVFKCESSLDQAFREAEPPTHDTWNPELVIDKRMKSAVNVAKRRILEEVLALFEVQPAAPPATAISAVAIADTLGGLLAHTTGTGAGRVPGVAVAERGGGGGEVRVASIKPTGLRELHVGSDDSIETWIQFTLRRPEGAPATLAVRAFVAVDDGVEDEPPAGTVAPWIVGLEGPDGVVREPASSYVIEADDPDIWWIGVGAERDVAVTVDIIPCTDQA